LGRETPLSFIPENLLRIFFYRDLKDLSPPRKGIFEATPVVNDKILPHIRAHKVEYLRGDTIALTEEGVKFNKRTRKSKPGDEGKETIVKADVIVLATGYKRPSVDFLPEDLFPEGDSGNYHRPNLYLQNFCVTDWSVLLTNSAYMDAIGTAGHVHIGIFARILMIFLMDEKTRPLPKDMKLWVDVLRFIKRGAPTNALDFFTYSELFFWLCSMLFFRIERLHWALFSLFGWGVPAQYE